MRNLGKTAWATFFTVMLIAFSAKAEPLMFLPFKYGESWYCTQGQGGSYSHQGSQYYGFDFNKGSNVNSTSNPAYGGNLYAPVSGRVVEIRDGIKDFSNNASSNEANHFGWGNTIVIRDRAGVYYVRLAHLRYGSIDHLDEGDWVEQGDYIGKIGQTGYSTSPHLHIQIMKSDKGKSEPFTFAEGKLYSYEWVTSALSRNVSMLDHNQDLSLSHNFSTAYVSVSGTWATVASPKGYAGRNYRRHKVTSSYDSSQFSWTIRVKQSGWYAIFVTFPGNSQNETGAKYYFDGALVKTLNQTGTSPFVRYVTTKYLYSNKQNTLSVRGQTTNRYVIADAVVLRRM